MKKVQILAHNVAREEIVAALREGGAIHITEPITDTDTDSPAPDEVASALPEDSRPHDEDRRARERELQSRLGKLEHVKDFLKPYVPKEKKSLDAMFNPRLVLDLHELEKTVDGFELEGFYRNVIELEGAMRSAEAEIARRESLADELEGWTGLDAPIETLSGTERTLLSLVSVESSVVEDLREELRNATSQCEVFDVSTGGSSVRLAVLYSRSEEPAITPVLKRHGARFAAFSDVTGLPEEAARSLRREAEELRAKTEDLRTQATELARARRDVLVVLDETAEQLARTSVQEKFAGTRETFLVEGWIRAADEAGVRERIEQITSEFEMTARAPERGEDVPVDFTNGPLVHPFEFVTTLYGRPSYSERDPTPLLAPFFIVFFGLCVSDGGYGVTLAAVSFFFMTRMQPGGGRQLMKLLMMGGISTAVVGAVTGGWFGIDPAIMPDWLTAAIVMNPLDEPMKMLNVVFILGIAQILTGLIIKMVADIRDGRWLDGVLDQLVWVFFLIFLAPLGYSFILGGKVPDDMMTLAGRGALVAGGIVVVTGARKNSNPIMKVLGGVLKLYDVVGYFGDVLSYARLLALGLATGAIAMAINGVADMAIGIPIIGPVAAVVILVGGHLFNLAVNCLGGFVHSARLQYLEFFSKFFTGGGRAFAPFRDQRRYSTVRK
jgi:V/A-type H+-transporting ATPase subunit I